ncbi:hypothetical protein HG530_010166 [Fusarium avenaceum]|nr:hypothetical protein HG530_010166 [Fusarium avenaceum]
MITRDNDFDGVRLFAKPIELLLNVCDSSGVCEITRVDENITIRDVDLEIMRVGDADHADGGLVTGRKKRTTAEEEYNVVE